MRQRRASDRETGEREALEVRGWGALWVEMALLRRDETVLRLLEDVKEMREERLERKRWRALREDNWSVLECPLPMMLMYRAECLQCSASKRASEAH